MQPPPLRHTNGGGPCDATISSPGCNSCNERTTHSRQARLCNERTTQPARKAMQRTTCAAASSRGLYRRCGQQSLKHRRLPAELRAPRVRPRSLLHFERASCTAQQGRPVAGGVRGHDFRFKLLLAVARCSPFSAFQKSRSIIFFSQTVERLFSMPELTLCSGHSLLVTSYFSATAFILRKHKLNLNKSNIEYFACE